jgi:plasmid stability protein
MPALVLKNVPEGLHERLKAQAAANRRSLTQEVIQLLERGVLSKPTLKKLPDPVFVQGLSDLKDPDAFADVLEGLINEGRP